MTVHGVLSSQPFPMGNFNKETSLQIALQKGQWKAAEDLLDQKEIEYNPTGTFAFLMGCYDEELPSEAFPLVHKILEKGADPTKTVRIETKYVIIYCSILFCMCTRKKIGLEFVELVIDDAVKRGLNLEEDGGCAGAFSHERFAIVDLFFAKGLVTKKIEKNLTDLVPKTNGEKFTEYLQQKGIKVSERPASPALLLDKV